jgi:hypothetical protein
MDHSNRISRGNVSNLGIVVLFLAILGCSCPKLDELTKKGNSEPSSSPATNSTPSSTVKSGSYDLTMEKYNRLKIGAPRAEVEDILGGKGTEVSSSTGGGVRFSVNKWEGDNFKSIILTFRNDKIMSKSQVGLDK